MVSTAMVAKETPAIPGPNRNGSGPNYFGVHGLDPICARS
ncbi:unnamed protein product [Acidithrix sp. C25]|nr:unnamed protein product [Acidithrix sp. C25]